jgi:Domain of unknown function (DUF6969)
VVDLEHAHDGAGLRVTQAEAERIVVAAAVIRECRRDLAAGNTDLVAEVTAPNPTIHVWQHYPEGEVYDAKTHAQYFFHVHPTNGQQTPERGHFHTFLRAEGMPDGVAPLLLPELAVADLPAPPPQAAPLKRGARDEVSHLVAIAVDFRGEPIRLFTTNRWVTGETWFRAEDVTRMLDCFAVAEPEPSAVLNRWIGAMIVLFRPQIAALLQARDEAVMAWRRRRRTHVLEDPRLEITSSLDIDLDLQLAFVDRLGHRPGDGDIRRAPSLPSLAEGWEAEPAG